MSSDFKNENSNVTQVEQALSAFELNYRRLCEATKDGILILDEDQPCEFVFK